MAAKVRDSIDTKGALTGARVPLPAKRAERSEVGSPFALMQAGMPALRQVRLGFGEVYV